MRYWIVSILMTLLLMPGRSRAQTKLSAKWEELTAGDFKEVIAFGERESTEVQVLGDFVSDRRLVLEER